MKHRTSLLLLLVLLPPGRATHSHAALWNPTGVPVCGESCVASGAQLIPDGAGGIYVAWLEGRNSPTTGDDVYFQRVGADGEIPPAWPLSGLPLCTRPSYQAPYGIAPDGQGGAVVAWLDFRGDSPDTYAQRVNAEGQSAPGWPADGAPVVVGPGYEYPESVCPDGTGGIYVGLSGYRDYVAQRYDAYAQRLTGEGLIEAPWPADGRPLSTLPGDQGATRLLPDGQGGAVVIWVDGEGNGPYDIYGLHLLSDGRTAPSWAPKNVPLLPGRISPELVSDGADGFYVACATFQPPYGFAEIYLHRFRGDGTVAPGWPEGGVLVCAAPDIRDGLRAEPDRSGGVLLAWNDYRGPGASGIYLARMLPDGSRAAGWTANGTLITDTQNGQSFKADLVDDGLGGAYVCWEWESFHACCTFARIQHVTGSGDVAPGWPANGVQVAPTGGQFDPKVVGDEAGGAIVVWKEGNLPNRRLGLFAQRFGPGDPTAVALSLVSVDATPERVALRWHGPGAAALGARVARRTATSAWMEVGIPSGEGTDGLRYEDRSVTPGERYAYRIAFIEDGAERVSTETWVDVPLLHGLTLAGFVPNPSSGTPAVAFSLPRAGSALLEVTDVSGRRVWSREVGGLGPGRHVLRVQVGGNLPPGVYWLRLRTPERSVIARGVVMH